jgi:hypothetical protein
VTDSDIQNASIEIFDAVYNDFISVRAQPWRKNKDPMKHRAVSTHSRRPSIDEVNLCCRGSVVDGFSRLMCGYSFRVEKIIVSHILGSIGSNISDHIHIKERGRPVALRPAKSRKTDRATRDILEMITRYTY